MLYTRKGDNGTSGLFGSQERLPKDSPVYDALGTLDELNSLLGVCRARTAHDDTATVLYEVQQKLFTIQAELAGAGHAATQADVESLEATIARLEESIPKPQGFVVAGSTEPEALLDYARAVSRRAERTVVAAAATRAVSAETRRYLNRLSSLLYALARRAAAREGAAESSPTY